MKEEKGGSRRRAGNRHHQFQSVHRWFFFFGWLSELSKRERGYGSWFVIPTCRAPPGHQLRTQNQHTHLCPAAGSLGAYSRLRILARRIAAGGLDCGQLGRHWDVQAGGSCVFSFFGIEALCLSPPPPFFFSRNVTWNPPAPESSNNGRTRIPRNSAAKCLATLCLGQGHATCMYVVVLPERPRRPARLRVVFSSFLLTHTSFQAAC